MLKFENAANGRYYYLSVTRDLLNAFTLCVNRGGRNVNVVRHYGFNDFRSLKKEFLRLTQKRIRNGYEIVN